MTYRTTPPDRSDGNFDLSSIFIAREQQLEFFDIYLTRWKRILFDADPESKPSVLGYPSPNNKLQGLIVLLYGRGGFGKSTLLGRYRNMAQEEGRNITVSSIVDWEFAVEGKRSLFNPPPGQEIDAAEYFRVLSTQMAIALEKDPKVFKQYQAAIKAVDEARKKASGVLESMQKSDRYTAFRTVTVEGLMALTRSFVPGSSVVLDNPAVKSTAEAGAKITVEHLSHLRAKIHATLGDNVGDYLDPSLRLGLALGRDLAEFARNFPLLIFFDTYEEVDEADHLLRIVMAAAGQRVGWVIAGRDNLWAGTEQVERSVDTEYGYKDLIPSDRGLQAQFDYESELSRLQRCYSFIFTEKAQPALHQEVRYFLRLWLLERRKELEIVAVNTRLKEAHESALIQLEAQVRYASLEERLLDEEWVDTYLDLAEQQFWLDPVEGVRHILPFMIAASIYRRDINEDAVAEGKFFETQLRGSYRRWWIWATQSLVYLTSRDPSQEELTGLEALVQLAEERSPSFPQLLPHYRKELEAALWWRLGEAYRGIDDKKALDWYEKALTNLEKHAELKGDAAETARNVASKLSEEKKYTESLPFFNRAIELDPTDPMAYYNRGITHLWLRDTSQARADYEHSYELDATDINSAWMTEWTQMNRQRIGIEREVQLEKIAAIDPESYEGCVCRGIALGLRGKGKEGLKEVERAISLSPEEWNAYFWKGMLSAYYYQGGFYGEELVTEIELSLASGLPPVLLTPLYWLEKDRPEVFVKNARPLLQQYGI